MTDSDRKLQDVYERELHSDYYARRKSDLVLRPRMKTSEDFWFFIIGLVLRACDDQVEVKLDPALLYDKNQIAKADAERLTLRKSKSGIWRI